MSHMDVNEQKALFELTEEVKAHRQPEHPVNSLFVNRWSPRSFASTPVAEDTLETILEAARWAPSALNLQPWRFIVAKDQQQLDLFKEFILPGNRGWTDHAPVLLLIASHPLRDSGEPNGAHAFDAGAAWMSLALQARALGLVTHAAGGFDRTKAREVLEIPAELELHAVIALGYQGGLDTLDEKFHARELPSGRRPIAESVIEAKAKA
ncbi:nitroreductase [Paenibacillus phyllosphaerae]|uniref:Nitroreductase n=1 Tax=Paenibacillus phyllosphaerae TaxID=274593 RepID=A0A7W5FRR8_9BACL|nr:nitroreductase family protein [Paenibacillus phyllosphaerae]MBB3114582.1 nitroreductase [Paenibacillus phyllosphaerae]